MYGILDCNNFYVSCERLFRPQLNGRPVVVLSNNDGCVVSRSNEAKALGIPMGIPLFQIEREVKRYGIVVCSSNYELYGDISKRVMTLVRSLVPSQEIYSIDECFFRLHPEDDYLAMGKEIRRQVLKGVGIPTGIGLAPTKTLAKLANRVAKKDPSTGGVYALDTTEKQIYHLKNTYVGDIWGIGRRSSQKLESYGVRTAYDLLQMEPRWVRQMLTITGLDTLYELLGEERIPYKKEEQTKSICRSRSFSTGIEDKEKLYALIMEFADSCCNKMIEEGLAPLKVMLFLHTNPYSVTDKQQHEYVEMGLTMATSNVSELAPILYQMLQKIYRKGYSYKRAGVIFSHLVVEAELLKFEEEGSRELRVAAALAKSISEKYGDEALYVAARDPRVISEVTNRKWVSPCFTTRLDDILKINVENK